MTDPKANSGQAGVVQWQNDSFPSTDAALKSQGDVPASIFSFATLALLLALATPALADDSLTVCKSVTTTQTTGGGVHDFSIRCQGKSGAAMIVMTHEQAQGFRGIR